MRKLLGVALLVSCTGMPASVVDSGPASDAGADAGVDAGRDAGVDGGSDAGVDAGVDAGQESCDAGRVMCSPVQKCWLGGCEPYSRISFTYYYDVVGGAGCNANPSCTTVIDVIPQRATRIANVYSDAGCEVMTLAGDLVTTVDRFNINCRSFCQGFAGGPVGCCRDFPMGTMRFNCSWTPP